MGAFWYFHFLFFIFNRKVVGVCSTRTSEWVASAPFRWCVWRHSVSKSGHPPSPWMRSHSLFHMVWRVWTDNSWIATSDRLFVFFFLFSLLTTKMHNCPLCLLFFNLSSHYLNFLFHPYFFYRSFFLILSFNYNFLYVLFFILFLILLIFYFVFIPF